MSACEIVRRKGFPQMLIACLVTMTFPSNTSGSKLGGTILNHRTWNDYSDIPLETESPSVVETFNPVEWISQAAPTQQITIKQLKVTTEVKLRYARTRIILKLHNQHHNQLQADFKIVLPQNAFFSVFQLKRGSSGTIYSARIVNKEDARNLFHFARQLTNGTVSAGYIELMSSDDNDHSTYSLKLNLVAKQTITAFLIYERQLERISDIYSDKLQFHILNSIVIARKILLFEFAVNVEELEDIKWLKCTVGNCTQKKRTHSDKFTSLGVILKERNLSFEALDEDPLQFSYSLQHNDTTSSAVVISQNNGNYYFAHLFVPKTLPPTRKHIVFLLDKSDSMHGLKMEQLQWSITEILDDLGPDDFFNLIVFSNNVTVWSPYGGEMTKCQFPYPADKGKKDSALYFINEKLEASGPTNIYLGLTTAFELILSFRTAGNESCVHSKKVKALQRQRLAETLPENVESMIFFLSDGSPTSGPTDPEAILAHFKSINSGIPIPIHTVAYGNDANRQFLRSLSQNSNGLTKVIAEDSGAGLEMATFYEEIVSKLLPKVETYISNDSSYGQSLVNPSILTVFSGNEVLTMGKLYTANNQSFNASSYKWFSRAANEQGKLEYYNSPLYDCTTLGITLEPCVHRIGFYIERLQVSVLLRKYLERDELVKDGYICPHSSDDTFQQLRMEALNNLNDADVDCQNIFKQKVLELAIKHGFITPYTSFVLTTNEVDSGLKNGSDSTIHTDSSFSGERKQSEGPEELTKPLKLIMIGSMTSVEEMNPSAKDIYTVQEDVVHEPLPISSKLVSEDNHIDLREPIVADKNFTQSTNESYVIEKQI